MSKRLQYTLRDFGFDEELDSLDFGSIRAVLHERPKTPETFKGLLYLLELHAESDFDTYAGVTLPYVKSVLNNSWDDKDRFLDKTCKRTELEALACFLDVRSQRAWDRLTQMQGHVPYSRVKIPFRGFSRVNQPVAMLKDVHVSVGSHSRGITANFLADMERRLESFASYETLTLVVVRKDHFPSLAPMEARFGDKFQGVIRGPIWAPVGLSDNLLQYS
jgi:hypothetical protein